MYDNTQHFILRIMNEFVWIQSNSKEMNFLLKQPLIFFCLPILILPYIYFLVSFLIVFFKKTNNIKNFLKISIYLHNKHSEILKKMFSSNKNGARAFTNIVLLNIRKFRYLLTSLPEEYFIIKN